MPMNKAKGYTSGLRPTTTQGLNPKDNLGVLKVPVINVTPTSQVVTAICMQDGEEKYGPYNWRHAKVQARIYLEAAQRHILALIDGQDFDRRTGKPHIGYALSTLQIYCDAWINGQLVDNRPLAGKAGQLIDTFSRGPGDPEKTPEEITAAFEDIVRESNNHHGIRTRTVQGSRRDRPTSKHKQKHRRTHRR